MDDDDIPNFSFNIDFQDLFNSVANSKTTAAAGNDEIIAFKLDAQRQQNAGQQNPQRPLQDVQEKQSHDFPLKILKTSPT